MQPSALGIAAGRVLIAKLPIHGLAPAGVVGTGLAGHALALTSASDATTAGASPSGRVVLHAHRQYYGPLGLPLRSARFHLRLIRAALP